LSQNQFFDALRKDEKKAKAMVLESQIDRMSHMRLIYHISYPSFDTNRFCGLDVKVSRWKGENKVGMQEGV
jgi:hypothetical protein